MEDTRRDTRYERRRENLSGGNQISDRAKQNVI